MKKNYLIIFIISILFFVNSFANSEIFEVKQATPQLILELQQGGFVVYIRHGKTDITRRDYYPVDLSDCSKQRPLTDEGREELRFLSEILKKLQIPLGNIYTSPMCRAVESTEILFGNNYIVEKYLMYTAQLTSDEKKPILEKTLELLSKPLSSENKNRIIVAHAPNLADLMNYFPEIEASVIIFQPLGNNQYNYLATILPDEWNYLLDKMSK